MYTSMWTRLLGEWYVGGDGDVSRVSNSGGSSRRRKGCCEDEMENDISRPACEDITSMFRLKEILPSMFEQKEDA